VGDANVSVWDVLGQSYSNLTGADGRLGAARRFTVLEYSQNSSGVTYFTPYAMNVSKVSYDVYSNSSVNFTNNFVQQVGLSRDSSVPLVSFLSPSSNIGEETWANITLGVSDNNDFYSFVDDGSLVGWWRMDDYNSTHVFDSSGHCYDNETMIFTRIEVECGAIGELGAMGEGKKNNSNVMEVPQNSRSTEFACCPPTLFWEGCNENVVDDDCKGADAQTVALGRDLEESGLAIKNRVNSLDDLDDWQKCYKYEWKYFSDLDGSEEVMTLNNLTGESEWQVPMERMEFNNSELTGEMYKIVLEDGSEMVVSEKHMVYVGSADAHIAGFVDNLSGGDLVVRNDLRGRGEWMNEGVQYENNMSESARGKLDSEDLFIPQVLIQNESEFSRSGQDTNDSDNLEYKNICDEIRKKEKSGMAFRNSLIPINIFKNGKYLNISNFNINSHARMAEWLTQFVDTERPFGYAGSIPAPGVTTFSLQPLTETYSKFSSGEEIYFMNSDGEDVKIKSIEKGPYDGQIYSVDVENDIVLVKRGDGNAFWSGNSNNGTRVGNVTPTVNGKWGKGF
jgi:hypothetical protein